MAREVVEDVEVVVVGIIAVDVAYDGLAYHGQFLDGLHGTVGGMVGEVFPHAAFGLVFKGDIGLAVVGGLLYAVFGAQVDVKAPEYEEAEQVEVGEELRHLQGNAEDA